MKKKRIIAYLSLILVLCTIGLILSACSNDKGVKHLKEPTNLRVVEDVIYWDDVSNAEDYLINISGTEFTSTINSFDLNTSSVANGEINIKVKARGDREVYYDSDWTPEISYNYTGKKKQYTLNVIAEDGGDVNIKNQTYDANTVVNLKAFSKEGYHFDGWFSDELYKIGSNEAFSFVINKDTIIYAYFSQNPDSLTENINEDEILLNCPSDFKIFIYCGDTEGQNAEEYIRNNLHVYDAYFWDSEKSEVKEEYLDYAERTIGRIENTEPGFYIVSAYDDNETYEKYENYVAQCSGNISILRARTIYGNSENVFNGVQNAPLEGSTVPSEEDKTDEFAFSIEGEEAENIKLYDNVVVLGFNPGGDAVLPDNLDGYIIQQVGKGITDAQDEEMIGGFTTTSLSLPERPGIANWKTKLTIGQVVAFGGRVTRGDSLSLDQIDEATVFGKIKSIEKIGEYQPIYFVELTHADESEIFKELQVYKESSVELEGQIDPNDEEIINNIMDAFYNSEDYLKFLAATQETAENFAQNKNYDLMMANDTKSFLDNINLDPTLKVEGTKLIIGILGTVSIPFLKKEGKFGDSSGTINISFEFVEQVEFELTTKWIKNDLKIKKGFDINVKTIENTSFNFKIEIKISADTSENYILNESTKCIHRRDCWHVDQMLPGNKKSTSDRIDTLEAQGYWPCGTCLAGDKKDWLANGEANDFRKDLQRTLEYEDWGDKLSKIKSAVKRAESAPSASKDILICPIKIPCVIVTFKLDIYLQMGFEISATIDYSYNTTNEFTIVMKAVVGDGIDIDFNKTATAKSHELTIVGKIGVKLGIKIKVSVSDPTDFCELGLYGTFGAYADLTGVAHVASNGENYAGAYLEIGVYYDFGLTYSIGWGLLDGSVSISKLAKLDGKIPIVKMGYSEVIYAYEYYYEEILIDNASEKKQVFTFDELDILKVKTLALPSQKQEVKELTAEDLSKFDASFVLSNANTDRNWFDLENNSILIKDNAPFGQEFDTYLTIAISNEENAGENFWTTFKDGKSIVYLPVIKIRIICALECNKHNFAYMSEQPATCEEDGYEECLTCVRCRKKFSLDEKTILEARVKIPATGHVHETLEAVPATCLDYGLTEGERCSTCLEVLVKQNSIEPLGHIISQEWINDERNVPSCIYTGKAHKVCLREGCKDEAGNVTVLKTKDILPHGHLRDDEEYPTCTQGVKCVHEACEIILISATGHSFSEDNWEVQEATCLEGGYKRNVCINDNCDALHKDSENYEPKGHRSYKDSGKLEEKLYCEQVGYIRYICGDCNEEVTTTVDPIGHNLDYRNPSEDTSATCEEDGKKVYKCKNNDCDYSESVIVSMLGHDCKEEVVASTCVKEGYVRSYCTRDNCDHETLELLELNENEHNYDRETYKNIIINGVTIGHGYVCTNTSSTGKICGAFRIDEIHAHEYNVSAPTETEAQVCVVCGYVNASALGHLHVNHKEYVAEKSPTCLEAGHVDYYTCCGIKFSDASCKNEVTEDDLIIDALGHDMPEEWETTEQATCTKEGTKTRTCTRCDYSESQTISMSQHSLAWQKEVPATCTIDGTLGHYKCSECSGTFSDVNGKDVLETVVIPAIGHVTSRVDAKEATCTDEGYEEHYKCETCNTLFADEGLTVSIEEPVAISAIGHTTSFKDVQLAGCLVDGYNEHWECDTCHALFADEDLTVSIEKPVAISAIGHNLELKEVTASACNKEGYFKIKCTTCEKVGIGDNGEYIKYKYADVLDKDDKGWIDSFTEELINDYKAYLLELSGEEFNEEPYINKAEGFINKYEDFTSALGDAKDQIAPKYHEDGNKDALCDTDTCKCTVGLNIGWDSNAEGWVVRGIGDCTAQAIVIPSVLSNIEGKIYNVKVIGEEAFKNCEQITSVTIPSTITEIYSSAFYNCINLASVTFESSSELTTIYESAFANCISLNSLIIPDSVTQIGEKAFYGCYNITNITLGQGLGTGNILTPIGARAFEGCYKLIEIFNKSKLDITTDDFGTDDYGCVAKYAKNIYTQEGGSRLINGEIEIDDNTCGWYRYYILNDTSLMLMGYYGDYKFGDEDKRYGALSFNGGQPEDKEDWPPQLIPNSYEGKNITTIHDFAFYRNYDLTEVTIPDSVITIGSHSFYECYRLHFVKIGKGVTEIGDNAFGRCYQLIEVENAAYNNGITVTKGSDDNGFVGAYAKYTWRTNHYADDLGQNGKGTFRWSVGSGYLIYEDGNDISVFGYFGSETNITVQVGLSEEKMANIIYKYAFYNSDITSVTIGGNIENIGDAAFYDCKKLKTVTLSSAVTRIGAWTFGECKNLESVGYYDAKSEQEAKLIEIAQYAFVNCTSLTNIVIPSSLTSIVTDAFAGCKSLKSVNYIGTIDQWCGITFGSASANPLYNGAKLYLKGEELTELIIPNTVTEIKAYAFAGCDSLTSVTIPSTIKDIDESAFNGCTNLKIIPRLASISDITVPYNMFGDEAQGESIFTIDTCSSVTNKDVVAIRLTILGELYYGQHGMTVVLTNGTNELISKTYTPQDDNTTETVELVVMAKDVSATEYTLTCKVTGARISNYTATNLRVLVEYVLDEKLLDNNTGTGESVESGDTSVRFD